MVLIAQMEKRKHRRIDVSLTVTVCCEPYQYQATVTNISEKGLCIKTSMCFPVETQCKISILGKEGVFDIQAFVKRSNKKEGFNETMGLELLNPSRQYREFVNTLGGV